jgi:hypothetical protein
MKESLPGFITIDPAIVAFIAVGFIVLVIILRWLFIKRAKLYVGYNLVPGVGPFIKFRVGTMTAGGKVKSFSLLTLGSLFGRSLGFISPGDGALQCDVRDEEGERRGRVTSEGKVIPGGRAAEPARWRSQVLPDAGDEPVGYVIETGRLNRRRGQVSMVARGAGAVLLLFEKEYSPEAKDAGDPMLWWDLCFISTILFALIFIVAAAPIYYGVLLFPFLGRDLSLLLTALIMWLMIWGILGMYRHDKALGLKRLRSFALFGVLSPARFNRRTGIRSFDVVGVIVCLFASVLFFQTSLLLLPIAASGLIAFVILALRADARPWPIHPRRSYPDIPVAPRQEEPNGQKLVARLFRWKFQGLTISRDYELLVRVRADLVEQARRANPSPEQKGGAFATRDEAGRAAREIIEHTDFGKAAVEVTQAVGFLLKKSKEESLTIFEEALNVMGFVQNDSIPYCPDEQSKASEVSGKGDYFRYPLETIYDQEGDSDCKAILAAALFARLGFNTILLVSNEGRAAVAIEGAPPVAGGRFFTFNGKNYYWCEASPTAISVGEMPAGSDPDHYSKYEVR